MGYGFGFSLDVPMMKFGTQSAVGAPAAVSDGKCGDSFALQQMLTDLGVYSGGVDGAIGSGTMTALRKFSEVTGVPYDKGTFPKAPMCQALMDTWAAKMAPAATPSTTTPASSGTASPFRVSAAAARALLKPKTGAPAGSTSRDVTVAGAGDGWWSEQGSTTKALVIGGGLAVIGVAAYLMMGKRAVPNQRRRTATERDLHRRAVRAGFTVDELRSVSDCAPCPFRLKLIGIPITTHPLREDAWAAAEEIMSGQRAMPNRRRRTRARQNMDSSMGVHQVHTVPNRLPWQILAAREAERESERLGRESGKSGKEAGRLMQAKQFKQAGKAQRESDRLYHASIRAAKKADRLMRNLMRNR